MSWQTVNESASDQSPADAYQAEATSLESDPDDVGYHGDSDDFNTAADDAVDDRVDVIDDDEQVVAAPIRPDRPGATGDPRVDDAIARLDDLDGSPTSEHVEIVDDVHRRLQSALSDLDLSASA
ncbi:unannotated protein [freshwater metagenome]|uniref:Unannotated protein n=1 Tax=freshwater metagenome TaxID=449393 RepID=A0A6J7P4B5_9ZZZZ